MSVMQIVWLALLYFSVSIPCEAAEQVRIAHNNLLPPFAEVKDGKAVGLVVDIFRTAAERAGYSVEFLPVPIEQMELALKDVARWRRSRWRPRPNAAKGWISARRC